MTLLVALLLAAPRVLYGGCGPDGPVLCPTSQLAFFEFAPASGVGMGAACACTTPTGAKGEALTFARASSGTCLKSGTTTGIANGDLVVCGVNQPRVMPGGDGSGGLGLLVEGARTNSLLRSEELDNAAWVGASLGAAAPTVTANQAVAPDGATTADRVQVPVTSGGQFSVRQQVIAAADYTGSVFVKGNGQSGTIDVYASGGAGSCISCSYNATTWTRCSTAQAVGSSTFNVGVICSAPQTAKDVFVWGAQMEVGTFASSYVVTTAAAVTRATETATFPLSLSTVATGSMAATAVVEGVSAVDQGVLAESTAGPAYGQLLDFVASSNAFRLYFVTGGSATAGAGLTAGVASRLVGWWDSNSRNACVDGACGTLAAGTGTSPTLLEIGQYSGANQFYGVVKRACVDVSSSRCR